MADDYYARCANLILLGGEAAPLGHIHLQGLEKISRDEGSNYACRLFGAGEVDALGDESRQITEDLILFLPILKIRIADPIARGLAVFRKDHYELSRIRQG